MPPGSASICSCRRRPISFRMKMRMKNLSGDLLPLLASLKDEDFCYLTTTGRVTGKPHEIEIWFALHTEDTTQLAMMAGGGLKSDWVRNLAKTPDVTIRISTIIYPATARIIAGGDPEEAWIRRALVEKYRRPDEPLTDWGRTALPILFTLHPEAAHPEEP